MSNVSVAINEHIYYILMDEQFDNFTVLQLRDVYLSSRETAVSLIEARKIVYRQILRLLKLGLLEKHEADKPRQSTYSKTALFYEAHLEPRLKNVQTKRRYDSVKQEVVGNPQNVIQQLEKILKQYQVDLLASIGESEEYMRLYETLPEMKSHLEMQYHQARERSSKLLGQIKAIKTIKSHYQKS